MNRITEEEINRVLLSSPMVLPTNPAGAGLKAESIKPLFYKFIRVFAQILNEHIDGIEEKGESELSSHNGSEIAHSDIRKTLLELEIKDTELGDLISLLLNEHKDDVLAHPLLAGALASVQTRVDEVYNLASGKSKIYPVSDENEMLSMLGEGINVGDKFVLAKQNVPDFILFKKNETSTDFDELTEQVIKNGVEPGKSYVYNGYLLVASESGMDTSLFARQTQLQGALDELAKKEEKMLVVSEGAQSVELRHNTEFNLGLRTSLTLTPPSEFLDDFEAVLTFRSGQGATTFSAPSEIIFTQDDCYGGVFTPISNRIYEISIKCVCGVLVAKVGACDYEVIE